jgi:uncharacterized protein YbjT (DUF2867 family)
MASPESTVLLAGATGLVGGLCLARLVAAPSLERIVPVGRRAPAAADARVTPLVTDFAALASAPSIPARTALCALGTTIKRAGSEAAFRAVDLDAVVAFARWARASGVEVFGLVSSVGAEASARSFYMRVKGEAEEAVAALGFRAFVALRPGLLLGDRTESRPGEAVGQALLPLVGPLLFGGARRFRAIDAARVGEALASLAHRAPPSGRAVWHHDELLAAARGG